MLKLEKRGWKNHHVVEASMLVDFSLFESDSLGDSTPRHLVHTQNTTPNSAASSDHHRSRSLSHILGLKYEAIDTGPSP